MPPTKIVISGANGFIGLEVLRQSLKHPLIHKVFAIVRKPLPDEFKVHPKVAEIIHADFSNWPQDLLGLLKDEGVRGCIWCIGGPTSSFSSQSDAELVNVNYPVAAAEAFANYLHTSAGSDHLQADFRFIYLSMTSAERDPARALWVQSANRHLKGAAEKALFEIAARHEQSGFELYALRLGKVLQGGKTMQNIITEGISTSINVERVAEMCVKLVAFGLYEGFEGLGKQEAGGFLLENAEILGEDWAEVPVLR